MSNDAMRGDDEVAIQSSASAGVIKALEYGVRALIATHPDPQLLNRVWQGLLSEVPDRHLHSSAPNPKMFHASMNTMLATLTLQIEQAAHS
jgi:rhamnogalacturonyl hydrolase YesR